MVKEMAKSFGLAILIVLGLMRLTVLYLDGDNMGWLDHLPWTETHAY